MAVHARSGRLGFPNLAMRRVENPPSPFQQQRVEWLDDEPEAAPYAALEVYEEQAKSILAENDSPDLGFRFSANPYRGCYHACAYCYARPSHQYWGFGAGTDFDRKIIVKVNAPALLQERFDRKDWEGERVVFSGNTDCYQPIEAARKLTRACLEVCASYRNPVSIITKSQLVRRDIDVLRELHAHASVSVFISIPFADDTRGRAIEPGASPSSKRFEALAALADAGLDTGIAVAPIIPGLNDRDIPELLERACAAGARHAFMTPVRLAKEVAEVFEARLAQAFPEAAAKVMSQIFQIRGGKKNESRFGARMQGQGPRWQVIEDLFTLHCKRLGLNRERDAMTESTFQRPRSQLSLF
jgi:DNA repair photolyase